MTTSIPDAAYVMGPASTPTAGNAAAFAVDTAGNVTLVDSGVAPGGGGGGVSSDPSTAALKTGKWYGPPISGGAVTTAGFTAATLYASPVFIPAGTVIKKFGIHITAANASAFTVDFGLYADTGTFTPGSLVTGSAAVAQSVAASATGDQTFTLGTPFTVATSGWYWLALNISATGATLNGIATGNAAYTIARIIGGGSPSQVLTSPACALTATQAVGTMPSTFSGSPSTVSTNVPACCFGT